MARGASPLRLAVLAVAALSCGCGGTKITSSQTTNVDDDIQADVLVHLSASAFKPTTLHLFEGYVATFVNDDAVPRTIAVDAVHSDQAGCSVVGMTLQPGERRATAPLPHFAVCYFVDPQRAADPKLQGVIITH